MNRKPPNNLETTAFIAEKTARDLTTRTTTWRARSPPPDLDDACRLPSRKDQRSRGKPLGEPPKDAETSMSAFPAATHANHTSSPSFRHHSARRGAARQARQLSRSRIHGGSLSYGRRLVAPLRARWRLYAMDRAREVSLRPPGKYATRVVLSNTWFELQGCLTAP